MRDTHSWGLVNTMDRIFRASRGPEMNYSQNDEQEHILRIFGDFVGRFLEIGACDGRLVSNKIGRAHV